jgi:hypothetical protein
LNTLPTVKLDHLYRLTDDTGIVEHAVFAVPNYREGYATDDNARALIVAVLLEEMGIAAPADVKGLAYRYLAFLWFALEPTTNRFRNAMSYERQWLEDVGSEDSHGHCGDWEQYWEDPKTLRCGALRGVYSSLLFRWLWGFVAHVPGPTPCWDCRSTWTACLAIAPRQVQQMPWDTAC